MPARDKTGPQGAGPLTGRGLGNCNKDVQPTSRGCGLGRGLGRGQGCGLGRGNNNGLGRRRNITQK